MLTSTDAAVLFYTVRCMKASIGISLPKARRVGFYETHVCNPTQLLLTPEVKDIFLLAEKPQDNMPGAILFREELTSFRKHEVILES